MAESAKADGASVAAQAPTPVAQAAEDALRAPSPTPRDLLALLWRRYLAQLSAHPLRTKARAPATLRSAPAVAACARHEAAR